MATVEAEIHSLDEAKAEAFAEKAAGYLNSGAIAVMMSLGHRTGLFDVMAQMPPATSHEIAEKASLAERYVREWLAVMVTGEIVEYDPRNRTYSLPQEHAASITRGAIFGNIAVYAQMVPMVGSMQDQLLECFETGAGLNYEDYPCFHQIMAEDSAMTVTAQLFDAILPLSGGLIERLESGIEVLDAGCGRGSALIAMAEKFPNSRFTGYDLCDEAIEFARTQARTKELTNITFEAKDLTHYDEENRFDLITTFDAVHDQADPQNLLRRLHRALKPGGTYIMQDIGGSAHLENNLDFPMASFLYAASCAHCMPVSLGQGGQGLGTMWGWETALNMLETAGFENIEKNVLPDDPMNVWFVSGKS